MHKYKEIGSEFWDVPVADENTSFYPDDTKWFISGRAALNYIISDIMEKHNVNSVALPSWCCDSMIYPFASSGLSVTFYPVWYDVKEGLQIDISGVLFSDILLIMDYFGYVRKYNYSLFKGIIIRDLTHSVLSKSYDDANYYFGSLRKWAGFWTGGFAWASNWNLEKDALCLDTKYVSMRDDAMKKKNRYIFGEIDSKEYLETFSKAELYLEGKVKGMAASNRDIEYAQRLDVNYIKEKRRKNALYLLKSLERYAIFSELKEQDCPLFVPIIVPNGKRDLLRKHLIDKRIYCPVHWPLTKMHQLDEENKLIYNNELSIICDQRYSEEDMKVICDEIECFMGDIEKC